MTVTISPALNTADIAAVSELAGVIWREYFTPIIGREQTEYMIEHFQSEVPISKQIAEEGFQYYLIYNEQELVGYFAFYDNGNDELRLSKIYLLNSSRGKGFGKEALAFIRKYAGKHSFEVISLTVNKYNAVAIAAYKKWGFEKGESVVKDIGGGFVMDDWVFRLRVA